MTFTAIENACDKKRHGVLIVDDDAEITTFMRELLSERYSVTIVTDGKSAIENIKPGENIINVVALDYRLPDISGLEVLREIKKIKPEIPVIFITAYGDEDVAVRAFRYGAKDYLKKPFNYYEFLNILEFSLSLSSLDKLKPRQALTAEVDRFTSDFLNGINDCRTKFNVQKALIYINNNYMNKITLDNVAKKACTSKYHFSREFKRATGCTYQEYLNQVRMEKARKLLKETKLSVTEAAFSVGYTDLTNFGRIFKKMIGCTPKEYKTFHDKAVID